MKNLEFCAAIVTICGIDSQEIVLWRKYRKIQIMTDKKEEFIFLLATNIESLSRYCFRSISSFSNRVPSVFKRTLRAKIALLFFFWLPQLHFSISWRETTSSFLRLSMKVHTFRWDLKILLLNLLFYPNKTSITLQFI
jgi:hypothetical protein